MKNTRTILFIIPAVLALIALGGCSGTIGGATSLRMYIPRSADDIGVSGSRYISDAATGGVPTDAHVLVAQQDKAYSYNNFDTVTAGTTYYVSNLFPDTYIIGVALLNSSDIMVNLKLQEYDMKPGMNDIPLNLGPGIQMLFVNFIPIENPFVPEGYTASFGTDTMILGGLRYDDGTAEIYFEPSPGVLIVEVQTILDGVPVENLDTAPNYYLNNFSEEGLKFTFSVGGDTYHLTIILDSNTNGTLPG